MQRRYRWMTVLLVTRSGYKNQAIHNTTFCYREMFFEKKKSTVRSEVYCKLEFGVQRRVRLCLHRGPVPPHIDSDMRWNICMLFWESFCLKQTVPHLKPWWSFLSFSLFRSWIHITKPFSFQFELICRNNLLFLHYFYIQKYSQSKERKASRIVPPMAGLYMLYLSEWLHYRSEYGSLENVTK